MTKSLLVFVVLIGTACGQASAPGTTGGNADPSDIRPGRSLSVVLRSEPIELNDSLSGRANLVVAMFGSPLTGNKEGIPYPILTSVPEFNTDTWKVFPNGRMETTYRVKQGITWHDGAPFTAEDMVFAHQVMEARVAHGLPTPALVEFRAVETVTAPALDTILIRWREPYRAAATPALRVLGPLPRHILREALEQAPVNPQILGNHPYWSTEYVHLGPYRVTQWERGAFLEGTAPKN